MFDVLLNQMNIKPLDGLITSPHEECGRSDQCDPEEGSNSVL